eukprot:2207026-Amphidinium_carterae.1
MVFLTPGKEQQSASHLFKDGLSRQSPHAPRKKRKAYTSHGTSLAQKAGSIGLIEFLFFCHTVETDKLDEPLL